MEYHSIRQLEELCKTEQKPVWKIVLKAEQTETDETEKQIFERMRLLNTCSYRTKIIITPGQNASTKAKSKY